MEKRKIRIAVMGDLHISNSSTGMFTKLFGEISEKADILVMCGDITQSGSLTEAKILLGELRACKIPTIGVLGNHDYESNKQEELKKILMDNRVVILDGNTYVMENVGFAGVKGFCGGFDDHMLASLGEHTIKKFVYETVNETLKLERAIAALETHKKIVILHYSPILQTVIGEQPEIIPFVGSSRLADPINRLHVDMVFHGHSHHGTFQGATTTGIPVYNVSLPVLQRLKPKRSYMVIEV